MRNEKIKSSILAVTKMLFLSLLFSLVLILILALIARWASLSSTVIVSINYGIKITSVLFGAIFALGKKPLGAINGAIGGLLYSIVSYLLFAALDGGFSRATLSWYDPFCLAAAGAIAGIIAVSLRKESYA